MCVCVCVFPSFPLSLSYTFVSSLSQPRSNSFSRRIGGSSSLVLLLGSSGHKSKLICFDDKETEAPSSPRADPGAASDNHDATADGYRYEKDIWDPRPFFLFIHYFHRETLSVVRPPLVGLVANHDAELLYRSYCAPYTARAITLLLDHLV